MSQKIFKAIAEGKIQIGSIEIDCAILENGQQVISRNSLLKLMGRSNSGGKPTKELQKLRNDGVHIPVFVSANNLIPFIPNTLTTRAEPTLFIPMRGGRATGYEASIIPDICDTYLEARKTGNILKKHQLPIAATLEIIARGLSRVGISALVMEACGIPSNEKDYLQKILNEYVAKVLHPWVRRFPTEFFENYNKMYGLEKDSKIPQHIGHFINKVIYKELAPGVLDELKKLNPKKENGYRSHTHHQFLTPNKGVITLEKQVHTVNMLMKLSKNKVEFDELFKRIK